MKVVPGSVTNTVESLERKGLVTHKPYRGVKLTEKGQRLALDVLRRHRLAERLLTEVLRLDWSRVHDVACRLEHAFATDVVKPLEKVLGHPRTCPHGNPIPSESGEVVEEGSLSLLKLEPHEKGIVIKVVEEHREILQYLTTLGLVPGAAVEMKQKDLSKGAIIVGVMDSNLVLDNEIASIIWVKKSDFKR